jgi:hypothetical protein
LTLVFDLKNIKAATSIPRKLFPFTMKQYHCSHWHFQGLAMAYKPKNRWIVVFSGVLRSYIFNEILIAGAATQDVITRNVRCITV